MNLKKYFILLTLVTIFIFSTTGCTTDNKTLKVAATSVPHAELLELIKDDLQEQGYTLDIIVVDDYNIPNRALSEKEVDANFFQHFPYLNAQVNDFSYELEALAKIHIEPMGLYSLKISSLDDLADGSTISIPNDPTNEARALALLHNNNIITLDDVNNERVTILNIIDNPFNLEFQEIDAALLSRTLEDVDIAIINSNFAMDAGLVPTQDALIIEEGADSPFVNILTIRTGEGDRKDLQALASALQSEKVKQYILQQYKGAVVPAF